MDMMMIMLLKQALQCCGFFEVGGWVTLILALAGGFLGVAGYPFTANTSACTPGSLVCNGSAQFGICSNFSTVWQSVAAGTSCVCTSAGHCTITGKDSNSLSAYSPVNMSQSVTPSLGLPLNVSQSAAPTTIPDSLSAYSSVNISRPVTPSIRLPLNVSQSATPSITPVPVSIVPVPSANQSSVAATTQGSAPTTTTSIPSFTMFTSTAASTPATSISASTSTPIGGSQASTSTYPASWSAPSSTATPSASASSSTGVAYKQFNGDGSVQDGWPSMAQWLSFDDLWTEYQPVLGRNCENAFGVPNNSPADSENLRQALLSVSQANNVPPVFALAIVMQESLGCVFVDTTNNGVRNPGLFQSHDGSGTCDGASTCPASEITQMCTDGIAGTSEGQGLAGCEKTTTGTDAQRWYQAARTYNSGSVPASGDLGAPGATACYASDIANRLVGWTTGESECTL